jgi:MFS family permease
MGRILDRPRWPFQLSWPDVLAAVRRLNPFKTADARRLAMLFGVVYFSQGMWYLPQQPITIVLKERGLSAAQVAAFFSITTIPWLVKPVYGLLSDFVPLFGRRRKSYLLITCALASAAGFALATAIEHTYWALATLFTLMAFGLAFNDVITDALMVENGRPLGLTGAFQSVQWAAITLAGVVVGVAGGHYAAQRNLHATFALAACFPLVSFTMVLFFIHDVPARANREAFRRTWQAIRDALGHRDMWLVAGFILFWTFSPSFGPALLYYQTDLLRFSQQFIGNLGALQAVAGVVGAFVYAPLSRRVSLRTLIVASIGVGAVGTLAYLVYRGPVSALVIDTTFGGIGMITQLAFLDLAAKACPRRVEGTFFALLMSVYNFGTQGSQVAGGFLYDWLGYTPLVLISAVTTALAWALVPFVGIDHIEATARAEADTVAAGAPARSA